MTAADQQANLLGALALAVNDRTAAAISAASGQSGTATAALSALAQFLDRPTIEQLRGVLGLTPSGAVRLVDRLAAAGLVRRGPGEDGRSRSVELTARGRRTASRLAAARAASLDGVLAELSAADRATLQALMGRLLAKIVQDKDGGAWLCRLCDLSACGRAAGDCPSANAAVQKYGRP